MSIPPASCAMLLLFAAIFSTVLASSGVSLIPALHLNLQLPRLRLLALARLLPLTLALLLTGCGGSNEATLLPCSGQGCTIAADAVLQDSSVSTGEVSQPLGTATSMWAASPAQTVVPALTGDVAFQLPDAALKHMVQQLVGNLPGHWAVVVEQLSSGRTARLNDDHPFTTASLYKLGVLLLVASLHDCGKLNYSSQYVVLAADNSEAISYGEQPIPVGSKLSIEAAARLMIQQSNNVASAFLLRVIGDGDLELGRQRVNLVLAQVGLISTHLDFQHGNRTTGTDVAVFFRQLYAGKLVSAAESYWMLNILAGQERNTFLAAGLPTSTAFAHKTGDLNGLRHDAGIVYTPTGPILIVALSEDVSDVSISERVLPNLGRAIYSYFNP